MQRWQEREIPGLVVYQARNTRSESFHCQKDETVKYPMCLKVLRGVRQLANNLKLN